MVSQVNGHLKAVEFETGMSERVNQLIAKSTKLYRLFMTMHGAEGVLNDPLAFNLAYLNSIIRNISGFVHVISLNGEGKIESLQLLQIELPHFKTLINEIFAANDIIRSHRIKELESKSLALFREHNIDLYLGFSDAVKSDFDAFIALASKVNIPNGAHGRYWEMEESAPHLIAFSNKWYALFVQIHDPKNAPTVTLAPKLKDLAVDIRNILTSVGVVISRKEAGATQSIESLKFMLQRFKTRIDEIFAANEILKSQRLGRVKASISLLKVAQTRETELRKDLKNVLNVLEGIE